MAVNGSNGAAAAVAAAALDVPECVHKALGGVADKHGIKKPRFHIESGSNEGDGYLSVLYRVTVEDEDGDADDLRLMCKTTMAAMEGAPFIVHVFKVEGLMYNKVLPLLEQIARLQSPLPWPRGYPNESKPPCLVMEDLRPGGFSICKRGTVLSDKHCRLFVTQIARFHGAGMALDTLRPDFIAEFRKATEDFAVLEEIKDKFGPFMKAGEKAPEMLTDRFPVGSEVYECLKERFATFGADFFEYLMPDPEGGNGLAHGDCHINNVMFQHDEAGEVQGCRLIDFQAARYAWPTPDLVGILLCVTEKPTRDAHWHEWLQLYHTELQATLRAAGVPDPDAVYSWERFQGHLQRACKMVVCMVPMMVHGFTESGAIKEIQGAVAQMAGEQPADPSEMMHIKETPTLKRRFGDVVANLAEWGLLL